MVLSIIKIHFDAIFSGDKLLHPIKCDLPVNKQHKIQFWKKSEEIEKKSKWFTFLNTIAADPIEYVQEHFLIKNIHIFFLPRPV